MQTTFRQIARLFVLLCVFALCLNAQDRPVAFVDVTVVPMDKEQLLPHQTVLVTSGRITQIGPSTSVKVPDGALSVDGRGKYLMPGLADMHVHMIRPWPKTASQSSSGSPPPRITPASASTDHARENETLGLLFVANGVTTVRNMWGDPAVDAFAKRVDAGGVLGPHIYSTGPITDGSPLSWERSRLVETQPQAEAAVKQDKTAGYIAIKVYDGLSPDAYHWLVSAAREQNLLVVGHVPEAVGLRGAIAARQDSIEHLDGFWEALQPDPAAARTASGSQLLENADFRKLPGFVNSIREAGVWICPTLDLDRIIPRDAEWQRRIAMMPPALFERYHKAFPNWQTKPELIQRFFKGELSITKALHEGGAHLLLGTDTPKLTVLPGFSLHEELQNLVAAGLTPYEAIRAGTSAAAAFLHQEGEFGIVCTGRRADLILLLANPLDDVDNVAKRVGVMVNGRWLSESELQQRLKTLSNDSPQ